MNMQSFSNLAPDRENATYHHIAYYLSGKKEHGWSKKAGMNEMTDKRMLLCSSLSRLLPGYFRKEVWQVEVYRRVKTQQGSAALFQEELVGRFWDSEYELSGVFVKDTTVNHFLKEFYERGDGKAALMAVKKGTGASHDFDFNPAGKTLEDLADKCRLLLEFYPRGQVERFYFEVKKRYFGGQQSAIENQQTAGGTQPTADKKRGKAEPTTLASLIPTHLQPPQHTNGTEQ